MILYDTGAKRIERLLLLNLVILFCAAPLVAQETAEQEEEVTEIPREESTASEPAEPAAPAPAETSEPPAQEVKEEKRSAGVNVDVTLSTIYNFRGLNVFKSESQQDQHAAFFPSLTWSVFDTGLYMGYWGAYQLTGDNIADNVASALGHEQDLYIGYDIGLADDLLTLSFAFTYFFYPFAEPDTIHCVEPLVGISVATVIDIGFKASYFHGANDSALSHAYFNLSLGKEFEFNDVFGMSLGMSAGAKAWVEGADENRFDLLFDWSVPINLTDKLYLTPGVHLGWTDLNRIETTTLTPVTLYDADPTDPNAEAEEVFAYTETNESREARGGDEFMVYGSIAIGADF